MAASTAAEIPLIHAAVESAITTPRFSQRLPTTVVRRRPAGVRYFTQIFILMLDQALSRLTSSRVVDRDV